ncbi:MAG: DEAD/DEAH box helicase [Desulfobulbaceae bacterium]|uniref:DEAD/DEAH box helicase n=1 Tax=Candidatus Desulfobia pelagia TaxID=2841692 RepID=A0A8J6TH20_9BACT|nr:DEAD/DEAH box helicase [Candidatus Desulfobia pelagia]
MNTFTDIGISGDVLKGLSALGFEEPTPVQEQVIPLMLERQVDLVSLAQTGTGKTAAFGLPLIQLTNAQSRQTQGLILCPTRELCVQVSKDLEAFSRYVDGLKILAVYGGASIEPQIKALRKGVQIIVATPGRLNDLIRRNTVDISGVRYVVFDEADEMLQMGFQDELNAILAKTPAEKNTWLFSATMSREVTAIASKYMTDPVELTIGKRNAGAENVSHEYYMVHARDRYLALKRIVDNCPNNYSIIFCRTRAETNDVASKLIQDGYNADALHGDLSQVQRDQVMKKFRSKTLQILVATDVAARGLDVNDLTHVINYNLPDDNSGYTHRSGRTGRAGRAGTSIAIIHMKEHFKIREIERKLNKKFKQCRIPSGVEICKNQLVSMVDAIAKVKVDHEQIDPLYAEISEKLGSFDREELIKRIVSMEFNRFLEYYKNAPDLNVSNTRDTAAKRPGKRDRPQRGESAGGGFSSNHKFTRFFLNVGKRDGVLPQGLIGKINGVPGVGRIKVGKIEINRNSALLEADSRYAPQILDAFQHFKINGKSVSIEVAKENQGSTSRPPKPAATRHRKGRKPKTA